MGNKEDGFKRGSENEEENEEWEISKLLFANDTFWWPTQKRG